MPAGRKAPDVKGVNEEIRRFAGPLAEPKMSTIRFVLDVSVERSKVPDDLEQVAGELEEFLTSAEEGRPDWFHSINFLAAEEDL